ncbi:MAG TPA: primosomal protein N', partial [Phycisphaerales bacterium]|nr:primosomal protein N' [Phycisphaerales bacterium]
MSKCHTKSLFGEDGSQSSDEQAGLVVRVAFDSGADMEYDYILPEEMGEITVGQRVEVPFGRKNKATKGFCVNVGVDSESNKGKKKFRLKKVKAITDKKPLLNEKLLELAWWISNYYVCPMGQVLAAMVPAAVKKGAGVKKGKIVYLAEKDVDEDALTSAKQKAIVSALKEAGAFDKDNARVRSELLEECECGTSAVKTLSRKGVVKFAEREVLRSLPVIPGYTECEKEFELNADQVNALEHVNGKIRSGEFGVTLLYGVTDSGKTEVYIRAIEAVIAEGKAAIVLLPEIALTTQTINRFSRRFKRIAVMHSGLTAAQRNGQWQKIRNGKADVVIGARSAVFAPLKNLGLIVVDEEHEGSYKQDTAPRYNGRDVAIKRAQLAGAHCLLGSATPSLEMLSNCKGKVYFELVRLDKRVNDLPMPKMELVDMTSVFRGSGQQGVNLISPVLEKKLKSVLAKGEQAILLLNRRGYSNFVFCPSCKHTLGCRNCDVTLTFHKRKGVSDSE